MHKESFFYKYWYNYWLSYLCKAIAIKYSKFVKIFTLKHKVTKQIRFIAPKTRVFPEKKLHNKS